MGGEAPERRNGCPIIRRDPGAGTGKPPGVYCGMLRAAFLQRRILGNRDILPVHRVRKNDFVKACK